MGGQADLCQRAPDARGRGAQCGAGLGPVQRDGQVAERGRELGQRLRGPVVVGLERPPETGAQSKRQRQLVSRGTRVPVEQALACEVAHQLGLRGQLVRPGLVVRRVHEVADHSDGRRHIGAG